MSDAVPYAETLEEEISMHALETERLILRPWRESDAEAMQAVVDHCFNFKGFTVLWGDYFPENPASGRVMRLDYAI